MNPADEVVVFEGESDMVDVEFIDFTVDPPPPPKPHVFDWCATDRTTEQHHACRQWYRTQHDTNDGRGRPHYVDVVVTCDCPTCKHPAPPTAQPTEGAPPC